MTISRFRELFTLGFAALATGCGAGASGLDSGEDSPASFEQALTLQGVERCSKERFETTVAAACSAPLRRVDAAPVNASSGSSIGSEDMYGVRLPASGEAYAGALRFVPTEGGEYIVYLGTPNIELRIEDAAGSNLAPTCGSHLPTVAPVAYSADCTLRGAYALNLRAHEAYTLRFGPSASHYVRVAIKQRRSAGVTLSTRVCEAGALSSTLASACTAAEPSTAITAAAPGSSNKQITVGTTHGVRLSAAGSGFEGTVAFTPPYTADYLVYSGTPNLGVSLLGAPFVATSTVCGASVDEASCPLWKAAFRYRRLEGGAPLQLEFGPTTQSWVRTLVLPAQPDSDSDGLADNYDQCPTLSFPGTACGCSTEECTGGALWSTVLDDNVISVAVDSSDQIVTVGTTVAYDAIGVRKFDASGVPTWQRTLSAPSWGEVVGDRVATDASGNIIVGGFYHNSSTGSYYVYLAKLNSSGGLLWENSFSNGEDNFDGRIAVDGSGNVFSLTTVSALIEDYTYEAVLRKFDADGVLLWTRRYQGKGVAQHEELAVDASGAALLTGRTRSAAFQGTETTFTAKYSAAGDLLWERDSVSIFGIAIAPGGEIVTHNPSALTKFNSSMTPPPLWTTTGFTSNLAKGLAVDGAGNIAVTGRVVTGGKASLVVRKFNGGGTFLWERAYERNSPSLSRSEGIDVAFTANGSVVVVGSLEPLGGASKGVLIKYQP